MLMRGLLICLALLIATTTTVYTLPHGHLLRPYVWPGMLLPVYVNGSNGGRKVNINSGSSNKVYAQIQTWLVSSEGSRHRSSRGKGSNDGRTGNSSNGGAPSSGRESIKQSSIAQPSHSIRGVESGRTTKSDKTATGSGGRHITSSSSSSSSNSSKNRHLLQSATCPEGCSPGSCAYDGTASGFKCTKCRGNLIVNKVTGECMCPAGRYSAAAFSCTDCPRGSYCLGGIYTASSPPAAVQCPGNMTTLGLRSTSNRACVNLPGYFYSVGSDGTVSASICPENTFGPGMRKQRGCVPCPTGLSTAGLIGQVRPEACVVPPGWYLKAPGQAAPCPQGEWKASTVPSAACKKCTFGVSTLAEASTAESACTVLWPGFYAHSIVGGAIKIARACPQGYWCPGGIPDAAFDPANPGGLLVSEPSIKRCPDQMWTQQLGSIALEQCLTPPGFKTVGGTTSQCGAGEFRSDWKAFGEATTCDSCGDGVQADKTDAVTVYNGTSGAVTTLAVASSSEDCYIQAGQGLYYESSSASWRARNCNDNNYGVPNKTYGLSPATCRSCPTGQIASTNAALYPNSSSYYVDNRDGTLGFTSVRACVNQAGWGYSSRVSRPCEQGTYNPRDTYGACQACPFGTTTAGVGAGVTVADCGIAAGYGFHDNSLRLCPMGFYNDAAWTADLKNPCTACPQGSTTSSLGGDSATSCDLCLGGYSGANCQTVCGGSGPTATYSPAGTPIGGSCRNCLVQETGYSFEWSNANDVFNVTALSRQGANSSTDCLANFAQIQDAAWWLPLTSTNGVTNTVVASFAACVQLCTAPDCQFVTYDYSTNTCSVRVAVPAVLVGAPIIGFKTIPSGDLGTNAWSVEGIKHPQRQQQQSQRQQQQLSGVVKSKSISSGLYTFYTDPNALSVGVQVPPPGIKTFNSLQDCLNACDDDNSCAGITIQLKSNRVDRMQSCALIYGNSNPGTGKRSMTRADVERLTHPAI